MISTFIEPEIRKQFDFPLEEKLMSLVLKEVSYQYDELIIWGELEN